jgi:hypothetical protein
MQSFCEVPFQLVSGFCFLVENLTEIQLTFHWADCRILREHGRRRMEGEWWNRKSVLYKLDLNTKICYSHEIWDMYGLRVTD